jgi:tetratricopeptide (TPR) repeat protein
MPRDPDRFDFFVSYARADNREGWITAFVEHLLAEHNKFTGRHELTYFFDKHNIHSFDDWQHSLSDGLQHSRLFLAFISPNYFASEWCRREWWTWIDLEIAKHILSSGAAPIYFVEVPGFVGKVPGLAEQATLSEQQVAAKVAELCQITLPIDLFTGAVAPVVHQMRDRRQITSDFVEPFRNLGLEALRRADLQTVLERLARDLDQRADYVRRAAESESTVPPYNKNFSGRLEELLNLRERLKDDRAGVISGVHGLGGMGKTELAFTYAHAFAGAYPGGRFHIECDGKATLRGALLGTGSFTEYFRGQIDEEEQKQPETYFAAMVHSLRERLTSHGHILLVLDNVTDANLLAAQQLDALTSLGPMLHLLATTRLPAGSSNHIAWLTLGELPETDALMLLEKHRPFENDAELEAARGIVRRLGGFALAVELVATYLAAHPSASYAGLEVGLGLDDLDTIAEDQDIKLRRHNQERRLGAILSPLLDSLSLAERLTIEYASILAPDHVALPWLKVLVTQVFPELAQQTRFGDPWEELCGRLLRLALFSRAAGEGHHPHLVRVHRLVQDLVRREMSVETLAVRQDTLLAHIRQRAAEIEQTTSWEETRWELEPLEALANRWADEETVGAAWLLNQTGLRWNSLASYARAEPLLRRALAIDLQSYGPEHPNVATGLNNLASLLMGTNRLEDAERLFRRALVIDEKAYGPEHPNIGRDLNNLSMLLLKTNRLAEAEPLIYRSLAIDEVAYGTDHPRVAIGKNNLAMLLKDMNRPEDAELLFRHALTSFETSYGPEHPRLATRLNNLAAQLMVTKRLAEAEPIFRRALAIDEAAYGPMHPDVARDLSNLSSLLQVANRHAEAEPLLNRALMIDESTYGLEHPQIATRLNLLAKLLLDTKRHLDAEPLLRRALAIDEAAYGTEHPRLATNLSLLSQLLLDTNRLAEAEPVMRRALAINEVALGLDHLDIALDLNKLAKLLQDMNRLEEAEPLLRRALAIDETQLGREHPYVATRLSILAKLLLAMSRAEEAESLLRRALAIDEKAYGPEHREVATLLNNLAQVLQSMNRLEEAEPLLLRALRINENIYGPDHPRVASGLYILAQVVYGTNRRFEAKLMMRYAIEILLQFTQTAGQMHPHLQPAVKYYNSLLLEMGRTHREVTAEINSLAAAYGVSL